MVTYYLRAGSRVLSALVLPWGSVLFGSLLGPVVGVVVLWLAKERHVPTLLIAAASVCGGTWLWNAMLNIRHATVIDGDIPFKPFPISWQDTGTGVFVFAFVAAALLATICRNEPGHRTLKIAGIAAAAALVMDIYIW
jgi:hypothetical protein